MTTSTSTESGNHFTKSNKNKNLAFLILFRTSSGKRKKNKNDFENHTFFPTIVNFCKIKPSRVSSEYRHELRDERYKFSEITTAWMSVGKTDL